MTVLCNDKGEIILDTEDYIGRSKRVIESFRKQGLLEPVELPRLTAEDYAEMKKAPLIVLDSLGAI